MVLLVPDSGTFAQFESTLSAATLASIMSAEAGGAGTVVMPRFKFSTTTALSTALAMMGMPDAFEPTADFSGIDGGHDLSIAAVFHQADIEVDEKGTTAAAATAVVIHTLSARSIGLFVDRPFLFFIRHNPTGAILFAGRVVDPTQ